MNKRKNLLGFFAFLAFCLGMCGLSYYFNPVPTDEQVAAIQLYDRISNERLFAEEAADLLRYEESRLRNYEKAHVGSDGKLIPIASWPAAEQDELNKLKDTVRVLKLRYNTRASGFNEYFASHGSPFKEGSLLPLGKTIPLAELKLQAVD